MEHQFFQPIPSLQIIICRYCKYGVYPKEVTTHLRVKHAMKPQECIQVAEAVQHWDHIIQEPQDVQIPRTLQNPLPGIKLHTDGMQCRQDPEHCQYITTHIKTMRKHWQQVHGWTQHGHSGFVSSQEREQGMASFQQSFRMVAWQKVFPTRKNSHLVHIQSCDPEPVESPTPSTDREAMVAEIKAQAAADDQAAAHQVICSYGLLLVILLAWTIYSICACVYYSCQIIYICSTALWTCVMGAGGCGHPSGKQIYI